MLRAILSLVMLLCAWPAAAHESLPLVVVIEEQAPDIFALRQQLPPAIERGQGPQFAMPESCTWMQGSNRGEGSGIYRCAGGLSGEQVRWTFPGKTPAIPTLVRVKRLTGEERTILAAPGETQILVPDRESWSAVAWQYLTMGIHHLLSGYDHLLFVFCLIWIAGTPGRVLKAVTGFTLAHSVTLILSALAIVRVPVPPVEAAIALSIMFLAREIAVGRRESLTWRHPMLVSSLFGLLHGLGFAAALRETGMPQLHLLTGLAAFNIGVEIGQVAVVLLIFAAIAAGQRLGPVLAERFRLPHPDSLLARGEQVLLLLIGGLSGFWVIERTLGFL